MTQPRNGDGLLTTRQGHPVENNQNSRTIGARGPATLENYHLIEKISHFDRERIPERVVHARGFLAHGVFEPTGMCGDEPMETYSRAKVFTEGTQTPISLRFSTVIGGRDSSEAARDPAASRSSSAPRRATGTSSATTCRSSSSATPSSSRTSSTR